MTATDRVDRLRTEVGTMNRRFTGGSVLAGAQLLFAAGIVLGIISFIGSSYADDSRDQRDFLILTLIGLGLCIGGAALYVRHSMTEFLRYWLARVLYEQQQGISAREDQSDRAVASVDERPEA